MVITTRDNDDRIVIDEIIPFQLEHFANSEATFTCKLIPQTAGAYYIAARVYAKNDKLPHRQDFALVKWL
jgi:phosphorylase/glycogen(starch) synthase